MLDGGVVGGGAASAYPHGFSTTLLEYTDPSIIDEDQVISAELAKIGIRVQIKELSSAGWGTIETGPAAKRMATNTGVGCVNPDPSAYGFMLGAQNTATGSWNRALRMGFQHRGIQQVHRARV